MASDLIEKAVHEGVRRGARSTPVGVSLRRMVGGGEPRSTRGQQERHPQKGTLSPIPNARNGRLEGVRLTQQHEGEEKTRPYRKFQVTYSEWAEWLVA